MPRQPEYATIAATVRAEVSRGLYNGDAFPGNKALADRFGVNLKTAGRAVQHLIADGTLIARPGLRPIVASGRVGVRVWPMAGRYARAQATGELLFQDVDPTLEKVTIDQEWLAEPPADIAHLFAAVDGRVLRRVSHTLTGGEVLERTRMHFPAEVVAAAPELETGERIHVAALLNQAGYTIARTMNEVTARTMTASESQAFSAPTSTVVLEHRHGTYAPDGVALEVVINVRVAAGHVITFDTNELPGRDEATSES